MNRTSFLVDGFNLYHSVRSASIDLGLNGYGTKWLDIYGLCSSYLHAIGNNAQIAGLFYFSALAKHLQASNPGVVARHACYVECLKHTGITIELARFKKKNIKCASCGSNIKRHEEKETDVAIAAKLLELLFLDQCDTCVLVTGDTDIVPAVKTAQRLFPRKSIGFLLPYQRYNEELARLGSFHFKIKKETYAKHQLPDPFVFPNGKTLAKPSTW
jgi:uncharacterized LabA/DUF88 family protein